MARLLENELFSISIDPDQRIVRSVRSERPYTADAALLEAVAADVERAFGLIDLSRYGHLLDLRAAVLNNSDDFESRTSRLRRVFMQDFARVAILVRTAVGVLQSKRLIRERGLRGDAHSPRIDVFADEADAMRFLIGAEALSSRMRPPSSRSR